MLFSLSELFVIGPAICSLLRNSDLPHLHCLLYVSMLCFHSSAKYAARPRPAAELVACPAAEEILHPQAPLALRISGLLLLGVVKIYSRQLEYFSSDCSATLSKLNQGVRTAGRRQPATTSSSVFKLGVARGGV